MKLFQMSWLLGMLSYVIGGVIRRSGLFSADMSSGTQGLVIVLLLILLAGVGTVLGVTSLWRKEVKSWWAMGAIGAIVLNIAVVLTGILLLSPG